MPTAAAHLAQADSGEGTGCPDLNEPKSSDKKPVATRNIAMRDLRWKHFLHGEHRNEILEAHKKEFDGLTGTILKELFPGDAKYKAAQRGTNCGLILEFKRVGVWKVRMVIQGFREDCVVLNGEDFKYNSDVAGLTAIRNIVFDPIRHNSDGTLEDVTLSSIDIAFAYLQSDLFPASCPPRYLKVKDPVTGTCIQILQAVRRAVRLKKFSCPLATNAPPVARLEGLRTRGKRALRFLSPRAKHQGAFVR